MAAKLLELFIKKALFKKGGAMANNKAVKFSADALEKRLRNLGIDPNSINSEAELNQILAYVKQAEEQALNQMNVLSGDDAANFLKKAFKLDPDNVFDMTGKKIDTSQGIMGGKSVKELLESGEVTKGTITKKSDKVKEREMFKKANEKFKKNETEAEIAERLDRENKEARKNLQIKLSKDKGYQKYKGKTEEELRAQFGLDDEPEKFYTGGMVDVEPNLSDIGHGSDALMARTRLVSPNSQATTSTGLNYLLAEDNDNIRIPFGKGKLADKGRRKFLKTFGTGVGGLAALKAGLINLAEQAGPKVEAVKETVSNVIDTAPPYFFRLVEKIRFMGDETVASQDKTIAKKYKDYVMEEDFAGNITIVKKGTDDMYPEDVYMSYKVDDTAVKDKDGFTKSADYEEFTATPDGDGKMKNVEQGVPDEVIEEAGDTTAMTLKEKADGGRIGFSKGKLALKVGEKIKTIGSRTLAFLEKVFGKEVMAEMPKNDPEMYQGLLEVAEAFRARDKEGLKMYLQKFLPHMDDAQIEDFIIGSDGTEGLKGQLIRLGSGRDYAGKLEMMKKADQMRKLDNLDVTEEMIRKPNASGGLAKLLGE